MAVPGRVRDGSARGRRGRARRCEAPHRRAARRAAPAPAAEGADLSSPDLRRRRPDASTGTSSRSAIRSGLRPGAGRSGRRPLPGAGAVHRERRAGDSRRGRAGGRAASPASRARAERLTRHVNAHAREEADRQPAVGARGAAHARSATATSTRRSTSRWRARSAFRRASPSASSSVRGAFYYHAWPEVYLDEGSGRGLWLPVDPTLNQFPADAHAPAARARRPRQAGGDPAADRPPEDDDARSRARARTRRRSWSAGRPADVEPALDSDADARRRRRLLVRGPAHGPPPMIAVHDLVKKYGAFTAVDGVSLEVSRRADPRLPRSERRRQDDDDPDDRRAAQADGRPDRRQRPRPGDASRKRPRRRSASSPIGRSSTRSSPPASSCASTAGSTAWTATASPSACTRCSSCSSSAQWEHELVESFSHGMKQRLVMCAAFLHRPRAVAGRRADGRPRSARRAADQGRLPADERARRRDPDEHAHARSRAGDVRPHQHHPEGAASSRSGTVDELRAMAGSARRSADRRSS